MDAEDDPVALVALVPLKNKRGQKEEGVSNLSCTGMHMKTICMSMNARKAKIKKTCSTLNGISHRLSVHTQISVLETWSTLHSFSRPARIDGTRMHFMFALAVRNAAS